MLGGEVRDQRDLLVGKRTDFLAQDSKHADHLALGKQRNNQEAPNAAEFDTSDRDWTAFDVRRIGSKIGHLHRPLGSDGPHDRTILGRPTRTDFEELHQRFWRTKRGCEPNSICLEAKESTELSLADTQRVPEHGLKDRLKVARRAADDLEHLRSRGLLLQRLRQIGGALTQVSSALA